ncbi:MmgE/PrpD family protein [Cupriavidus sp. 30B13]|uniref:MmgE/PrpD family protein n=1 Tax=Cupriavidus sp. 30B13 TaxID=3384241 RepID=UPI003B91581A
MHATEVFGAYAESFEKQTLPHEVLHHAKRAVVDWYAALYSGLSTPPLAQLSTILEEDIGRGSATLPDGRHASARTAALFNGTAAHAAEVDDSFKDAMYHPGAATIAAALAVAQARKRSGSDFLRSVILGYEISTRIGVVLGRAHYKYWHNTGTVGAFGAAAAAGLGFGLSRIQFAHALATVGTFSAGLQQAFRMDSMSKPLHAGRAAEAGVFAADMARHGTTGSLDILDGDAGFGRAMSDGPDWSGVGSTLGEIFNITRLTFKNHIGCGHAFPAIDATLALMAEHHLQASDIRTVSVATYGPALDIACYAQPRTENEARFSIPFVIATAILHGSVRQAAYSSGRLADAEMRAMMARVTAVVDPELDLAFPKQRSARVEIETMDGRRHVWLQKDRKGDPELPLSDRELEGKFRELVAPVIGNREAGDLLARIWSLDSVIAM